MLRRNVLIFHSGALGDFIVTWPLALSLARLFPQSRIYYITQSQKGALAERVLRLESADAESGWHQLFSESPVLPEPALKLLTNAHTILSFVAAPVDRWSENVRAITPGSNLIWVNTVVPENFAGHVTEWMVEQWGGWAAGQAAARQILHSFQSRGLPLTRSGRNLVIMQPGAGSSAKCWPPEHFLDLTKRLVAAGRQVRVLLGEVELEQWPRERIAAFESICDVQKPANYLELLTQLADAATFIGNDSGPGHLAGIVGIPTISLFASSNPNRWKPLGPNVKALTGVPDRLSVEEVRDAVLGSLA
jgi:ADP-heptose:LPS heptosyltransferase